MKRRPSPVYAARLAALLGSLSISTLAGGQETPNVLAAGKTQALAWAEQVTGRHCYLKEPRFPLLVNDEVAIVRCVIRYTPDTDLDTGVSKDLYSAKLWFEGIPPAPQEGFRMTVENISSLDTLVAWLITRFSPTPLEEAYDWPPEVKSAVRYRYIALGMDRQMVSLALGGLGYQVDLEQLDDKRVRETWKMQVKGDTRRIFSTRTSIMNVVTSQSSQASATISTFMNALGSSAALSNSQVLGGGSSLAQSNGFLQQSGFFIFSGLPPELLYIVFTDGKVTARRTEFVK